MSPLPRLSSSVAVLALLLLGSGRPCFPETAVLAGRALLPAATFAEGPTSGTQLGSANLNGQVAPFHASQPVQGFSGIVDNKDGTFLVTLDNGFGSLENSADSLLRVYRIRPHFKTAGGGTGVIEVLDWITLHDPDGHLPFTITQFFTRERLLTGADLDPESLQRAPDGTLWFGDEFGPFLLHTDASGRVLEPPIPLPDHDNPGRELRSPQNPFYEEASALRIMNAARHHARAHGATRAPVFSPWAALLQGTAGAARIPHPSNRPSSDGPAGPNAGLLSVKSLQAGGFSVVPWTVNDPAGMKALLKLGVDGLISDRPDLLYQAVSDFDADGDGRPGDLLLPDGRINRARFDAQGHRGARDLRPENTLPAIEAALDHLMTTLELDCGLSREGVVVLCHEPNLSAPIARRVSEPARLASSELIRDLTAAELQGSFLVDGTRRGEQVNDPAVSPVALAFLHAKQGSPNRSSIYSIPTLAEVFDFVSFYARYYAAEGPGASHPRAPARSRNAAEVRFNLETKLNPRTDTDSSGRVFRERTAEPQAFVDAIAGEVTRRDLDARVDIQSFDFRTLLLVQAQHPSLRTVYLFGDFPRAGDGSVTDGDGANLQPQGDGNSPWLAGMIWPYGQTLARYPARVVPSGGLEGMALSVDGETLLPLLEKPLVGGPSRTLFIHPYHLPSKRFTGARVSMQLDPRGTAVGDFAMYSPTRGMVIERDSSQGRLDGFKAVFEVEFDWEASRGEKRRHIDLQKLADPHGLSGDPAPGVIGLGREFSMPFATIENIVIFDPQHFGVINDNNYPFGRGRYDDGRPDDTEFVLIQMAEGDLGEGLR